MKEWDINAVKQWAQRPNLFLYISTVWVYLSLSVWIISASPPPLSLKITSIKYFEWLNCNYRKSNKLIITLIPLIQNYNNNHTRDTHPKKSGSRREANGASERGGRERWARQMKRVRSLSDARRKIIETNVDIMVQNNRHTDGGGSKIDTWQRPIHTLRPAWMEWEWTTEWKSVCV